MRKNVFAIMEDLHKIWTEKSDEIPLPDTTAEIIIGGVFIMPWSFLYLSLYFFLDLQTIPMHSQPLKWKFFCSINSFLGLDIIN